MDSIPTEKLQTPSKVYLFGYPISHSLAPVLHSSIFQGLNVPWTFELVESKDKADFLPKLHATDCVGAAVTMPHKVNWIKECDEVTEEGRVIGAINTVVVENDAATGIRRYIGTNTDCIGVREAFFQSPSDIPSQSHGKPAMVIGGGGACRSAVYALYKWLGGSEIYMVNRVKEEVDAIAESFLEVKDGPKLTYISSVDQAVNLPTPALVVGTIPDFPPTTKEEKTARHIVEEFLQRPQKGLFLEMCYHPKIVTSLYLAAESNGWTVIPGTEAMIHQGIAQEMLWMGKEVGDMPVKACAERVNRALVNNR